MEISIGLKFTETFSYWKDGGDAGFIQDFD